MRRLGSPRRSADGLHVLGELSFRGKRARFGLLPEDRLRHLWVIGKTGSGKSTLLEHLIVQDLTSGSGVAVLDPHGSLVEAVLPFVPRHRTNEVCLFAPADREYPLSWNVFRLGRAPHPDPGLLASSLIAVMKKQWADSWGPRLEHILRNAILAVSPLPEATLLLLYRFLTDEAVRTRITERTPDPVVRSFWTREWVAYGARLQAEAVAPVTNKLGAFVANPTLRALLGQVRSRLDLRALMDGQGILLAPLRTGAIGEDASHLLGGLLLANLQLAGATRAPGAPRFTVYVDEFQNFVTEALATMLAESRKFGLALVLAHQYLGQLPERLAAAVLGNVGSIVAFRLGAADAEVLGSELAPTILPDDLMALPPYHAAVRVLARGAQLPAVIGQMLPPLPRPENDGRSAELLVQSRLRYARPRSEVEAAILRDLGS